MNMKMITKDVSPLRVVYSYSEEVKKIEFFIDILCLGQVNEMPNCKHVQQKYFLAHESRI